MVLHLKDEPMQARLLVFVQLHRPFGDGNQQRDILDERMNIVLLIPEGCKTSRPIETVTMLSRLLQLTRAPKVGVHLRLPAASK
jgi:hypothetical protein